ncbi:MAG: GNAT family N-acetyltransferase [Desulfitobacteriaceae bacterium]
MINLESMVSEDLKQVIEWNKNSSPEFLLQWSGEFKCPLTKEQLDKFYCFGEKGTGKYYYKIVDIQTCQAIGIITLKLYRYKSLGVIINFLIGEESMRGKGIGQKALTKMIHKGFTEFCLSKIRLNVFDYNDQAIRCYEKVGFVKERLLKCVKKVGDSYWHMFEMSIFEDEWRSNSESHNDA